jgi:hypothetical protein
VIRRLWRDARIIAIKDATEMWRDGRFRLASALLFAILGTVFVAGWSQAASAERARAEAQREEREVSLNKGAMNPHAAAHYGAFVFKPVQPPSAIDPGLDPFVGGSVSRLLGRFLEDHPSTGTGREGMQQYAALQEAREAETARLMQRAWRSGVRSRTGCSSYHPRCSCSSRSPRSRALALNVNGPFRIRPRGISGSRVTTMAAEAIELDSLEALYLQIADSAAERSEARQTPRS